MQAFKFESVPDRPAIDVSNIKDIFDPLAKGSDLGVLQAYATKLEGHRHLREKSRPVGAHHLHDRAHVGAIVAKRDLCRYAKMFKLPGWRRFSWGIGVSSENLYLDIKVLFENNLTIWQKAHT